MYFSTAPLGMWDPSSPTRDQTCTYEVEAWSLNHWTKVSKYSGSMVTVGILGPRVARRAWREKRTEMMALGCSGSPLLRGDRMLESEKGARFQTFTSSEGIQRSRSHWRPDRHNSSF